MRKRHFIDSHKGATPLFVLALMAGYGQWENPTAWIYLATHGGYGVLWVLKSRIFGDRQWEQGCGIAYGLSIWVGLSFYWISPWLICSRSLHAPPWLLGAAVAVWGLGVFLHFAADMQKHAALKAGPGLITDGLFARLRNPNYFGELLIYAGFSSLAMHWIPFAVLLAFVLIIWMPNMRRKDSSLSRYPEFESYRRRSKLFLPGLF